MKKKLLIVIGILILIVLGILIYFKFIKKNESKNNIDDNKTIVEDKEENNELDNKELEINEEKINIDEENINENEELENNEEIQEKVEVTNKLDNTTDITEKVKIIDEYDLIFKIDKDIEGLYDEYKNLDFSFKTNIKGSDITAELDDVSVKIENNKIIFKEKDKTIEITNIKNPVSLRLQFDVANEDGFYPLYVLNNDKELYKVEINKIKVNLIEKVLENVDSFDFVDGNNLKLTSTEGENLILVTKSNNKYKINGIEIENYDNVRLFDLYSVGKKSNNFIKYDNKELTIKSLFMDEEYYVYIITNDNNVLIFDMEDKKYLKNNSILNYEINNNEVIINYENKIEKIKLLNNIRIYNDGKIIDIK